MLRLGKGTHLRANPAMVGSRQQLMCELAHRTSMRITVLGFTGSNIGCCLWSAASLVCRAVLRLRKDTDLRANPTMIGSRQQLMYELAHRTTMRITVLGFTGSNIGCCLWSAASLVCRAVLRLRKDTTCAPIPP